MAGEKGKIMGKGKRVPRDPRDGGAIWNWFYKYLAGPADVTDPLHGCSAEARELWKRDLENRKRYSRELRERKRAAREG
jgi:hypothetical protein